MFVRLFFHLCYQVQKLLTFFFLSYAVSRSHVFLYIYWKQMCLNDSSVEITDFEGNVINYEDQKMVAMTDGGSYRSNLRRVF